MADIKIFNMVEATSITDTDLIVVEDSADTKKITKANFKETMGINAKALNSDLTTHVGDLVSDVGGVHGLAVTEGTWTPTLIGSSTAGTPTYGARTGKYIRVGNKISCFGDIAMTNKGGMGGNLRMANLPFANSGISGTAVFSFLLGITNAYTIMGYVDNSEVIFVFRNNTTMTSVVVADVANSARIIFSLEYFI